MSNATEAQGRMLRHNQPKAGPFAPGNQAPIALSAKHIDWHIGPYSTVWDGITSALAHVESHVIPPSEQRRCHTLVTSGLRDRPLSVPQARVATSEWVDIPRGNGAN